jgi:hypothetical protein
MLNEEILETAAALFVERGRVADGAIVLGSREKVELESGLPPEHPDLVTATMERARAEMASDALAVNLQRGRRLPVEKALAYITDRLCN